MADRGLMSRGDGAGPAAAAALAVLLTPAPMLLAAPAANMAGWEGPGGARAASCWCCSCTACTAGTAVVSGAVLAPPAAAAVAASAGLVVAPWLAADAAMRGCGPAAVLVMGRRARDWVAAWDAVGVLVGTQAGWLAAGAGARAAGAAAAGAAVGLAAVAAGAAGPAAVSNSALAVWGSAAVLLVGRRAGWPTPWCVAAMLAAAERAGRAAAGAPPVAAPAAAVPAAGLSAALAGTTPGGTALLLGLPPRLGATTATSGPPRACTCLPMWWQLCCQSRPVTGVPAPARRVSAGWEVLRTS